MRLYIHTSPNQVTVPFDYQQNLVGALHKWMGKNQVHDDLSLYSLSWLSHGQKVRGGLHFPIGAQYFISAPDQQLIKQIIGGIQSAPEIAFGMQVQEMSLKQAPDFGNTHTFFVQSPVFIKRSLEKEIKFFYPKDPESDQLLTETLQHKLRKAGREDQEVSVAFDRSYPQSRIKAASYKGITSKGSLCPVTITGDPEALAFAWQVGVGNGTGIGWGALK